MAFAKGEYINFLDPDDIWDSKAFEFVLSFLKIYKDINILSGRMKFFEARNDYHPLDYKFYKTRVTNLTEEYNCIQSSSSTSFFRNSLIIGKKFEEGLSSGEDTRLINDILLINPIIGFIREAIYFCRKRGDFTSRTQTQKKDVNFYILTIKEVSLHLIEYSKALYNRIVPFIQFYVAYDLLFRIETLSYKYLDHSNYLEYCKMIEQLLQNIEDKYILEQNIINNKYKILALSRKYKRDIRYEINFVEGRLIFQNYTMINLKKSKNTIIWRKILIENDILHLEGVDNLWLPKDDYFYFCKLGNRTFYATIKNYSTQDFDSLFGVIEKGKSVVFNINLIKNEKQVVNFNILYRNIHFEILTTQGYLTNIPSIPEGYFLSGDYIIQFIDNKLTLYKYNTNLEQYFEKQYCNKLEKLGKKNIIKLRTKAKNYRKKINLNKCINEIWLINDKLDQAGDNGEFFFRYLRNKKPPGIDAHFVIKKNCSDYQRLKKLGNIIDFDSDDYLITFLKSDKIISSVSNYYNPFDKDFNFIKDLFHFNFIFIQNGIIKDDLSKIMNNLNSNIDLFVTSSIKEYNSLLSPNYGYKKNSIILTGLPRYDNLENYNIKKVNIKRQKRIILVIPTWRLYIKGNIESLLYESIHSDTFKNTQYFKFFNSLINNQKLLEAMNLYNYTGIFCLHQYFSSQWIDFKQNTRFEIKEKCNYQKLLIEGSLLITDYSSIFFDFGYMKKPVIYTHFDYDDYRMNHYQEGYFNYKRDGFGPIKNDIKSTVDSIIDSIKNNCSLKSKYLKRINSFFSFFDVHNNDRLYENIIKNSSMKRCHFETKSLISFLYFIFLLSLKIKNIINYFVS